MTKTESNTERVLTVYCGPDPKLHTLHLTHTFYRTSQWGNWYDFHRINWPQQRGWVVCRTSGLQDLWVVTEWLEGHQDGWIGAGDKLHSVWVLKAMERWGEASDLGVNPYGRSKIARYDTVRSCVCGICLASGLCGHEEESTLAFLPWNLGSDPTRLILAVPWAVTWISISYFCEERW